MFYAFAYHLAGTLVRLLFRVEVVGREHVPAEGPVIVAANHASYVDPVLVAMAAWPRQTIFMAKAELFSIPVLGAIITWLGAFPVSRGAADRRAIQQALVILGQGGLLGIYPQGTRRDSVSAGDQVLRGVGLIACRSGAQVVPLRIHGSERIWRGGLLPIRLPRIRVELAPPILPTGAAKSDQAELIDRVVTAIAEMDGAKRTAG